MVSLSVLSSYVICYSLHMEACLFSLSPRRGEEKLRIEMLNNLLNTSLLTHGRTGLQTQLSFSLKPKLDAWHWVIFSISVNYCAVTIIITILQGFLVDLPLFPGCEPSSMCPWVALLPLLVERVVPVIDTSCCSSLCFRAGTIALLWASVRQPMTQEAARH